MESVHSGTVAQHSSESAPTKNRKQLTYCAICKGWFKPQPYRGTRQTKLWLDDKGQLPSLVFDHPGPYTVQ